MEAGIEPPFYDASSGAVTAKKPDTEFPVTLALCFRKALSQHGKYIRFCWHYFRRKSILSLILHTCWLHLLSLEHSTHKISIDYQSGRVLLFRSGMQLRLGSSRKIVQLGGISSRELAKREETDWNGVMSDSSAVSIQAVGGEHHAFGSETNGTATLSHQAVRTSGFVASYQTPYRGKRLSMILTGFLNKSAFLLNGSFIFSQTRLTLASSSVQSGA
uniref:Uncharacterized protein n=1 Tax=Schistocephalus solidus TaxID=70667 RepID=A0A0X3PG19_SCHSO